MSSFDTQIGGDHYLGTGIQPIEYIMSNDLGFCEGNVVKYVSRYKKKGGLQDLYKAQHYLAMLIETSERTESESTPSREREPWETTDEEWVANNKAAGKDVEYYEALAAECERRRAEADEAYAEYILDREQGKLSDLEKKMSRNHWR